jgi:hypothetical protein
MTSGIPWWARIVMSIDHNVRMLSHAVSIVRDETMLAFVPPDRRPSVTTAIYDRQRSYGPGGELFALGLYEWERRLIATPPFPPPPARILLGGAGGGREVVPLRDLGYEVWSFEPSPQLVAGAQREIGARGGASLVVGDYDDLVRAVRGESTRLSPVATQHYDAIILGWGSLSYVTPEAARLALLVALKTLAPNAPVILSFIPRLGSDERGRAAALRRGLRRLLPRLGGQPASDSGELFVPWGGFASALPLDEIERLALQSGYRPAVLETEPYGHALLVPA